MENNRPLGWTTINEAKRLVEAGLDPNTADMYYFYDTIELEGIVKYINGPTLVTSPYSEGVKTAHMVYPSPMLDESDKVCPCWSLGALIEILPYKIKYEQDTYSVLITKNHVSYPRLTTLWSELYSKDGNNTIECVVNVIIILLEDGYIKMDTEDLMDRILSADKFILKQRNKEAELRNKNHKACDKILKELGYQATEYVSLFLVYAGNTIPVGSGLLDKVRETATEKELEVLKKHGIKL